MRGLWRRLVHLGIDDRSSAREAKHLVITNAISVLSILQCIGLLALSLMTGLRIVPLVIVTNILGCAAAILNIRSWLAWNRTHFAASCCGRCISNSRPLSLSEYCHSRK